MVRLSDDVNQFRNGSNGHASSSCYGEWQGDRPPRILILSASVGTGHLRAAQAVELALRQAIPEAVVRNIDVLTLSTPPFRHCYGHVYIDLIDLAPSVLGFFYNLMDRPRPLRMPGRRFASSWKR
jgi:hypothetical protein